ncbi:MAG: hypothetical protein QF819_05465 [Gemmatimonadota bacterium]|jgi:hypothetical protein|nr:hypothetical protein [Gemmatimonadota bacterium]MDP6802610.1 hypothetical protein [Gemmatimonadota bacterium]MDP7030735.1 hypothetical protein [Gemmatimonadota bacterium]
MSSDRPTRRKSWIPPAPDSEVTDPEPEDLQEEPADSPLGRLSVVCLDGTERVVNAVPMPESVTGPRAH